MPPKLGEYILQKPIGRGAMGQVWLAKQESLDRMVAVKILPKEFATDASFRARFEREAKMAASMIHPNVIQIFSYGIEQNVPYFAMEFVEGQDLSVRIRKKQKFTMRESVKIVADVARALEVAHEKGLVHRDIKPGNIMISNKGIVKVMDFGLAKAASVQSAISQPGLIMGTPSYMSPEQGMGQELDVRSDIYALGVVLYKLLTGELPFVADKPTAVIFMHIYENAKPVRELNPEVPGELAAIVAKMMAKKQEDRYGDPSVLVSDLDGFLAGTTTSLSVSAVQQADGVQATEAIGPQAEPTSKTEAMVAPDDPTVTTAPPAQSQMVEPTEPIVRPAEPTSMPTQAGPAPEAYARTEDAQLDFLEDLIQGDDPGVNARAQELMEKSPGLRDKYARQLFIHALVRSQVDSLDRVGKGRRVMKVLSVLGIGQQAQTAMPAATAKTGAKIFVPKARGPMFYYAVIGVLILAAMAAFMIFLMPAFLPAAEQVIQTVRDKTYDNTDRIYDVTLTVYETGVKNMLAGKLHVRGADRWVAILKGGTITMGSDGKTGWVNPPAGRHIVLENDRKHLAKFSPLAAELPRLSMEDILPKHGKFYFTMIGESFLQKYPDRNLVEVKASSIPGRSDSPIDEATYWLDKDTGEIVQANMSLQPGDMGAGPRAIELRLAGKKEFNVSFYNYNSHNLRGKSVYNPASDTGHRDEPGGRLPGPGGGETPW